MAKGQDGGIKSWQPKNKVAAGTAPATNPTGRRDGGARLASGVRDGNVREWQPKGSSAGGALKTYAAKGAAPSSAAAPTSAPTAASAAPCVGCGAAQLKIAPGTKADLRGKLESAIDAASSFLLGLFDAALVEASGGAPSSSTSTPRPWEASGFHVSEQGAAIVVGSVIGNSPAGHAGLEPMDVIVEIEDTGRPTSLAAFAQAWARGDKFDSHRLTVERSGARIGLDIATS